MALLVPHVVMIKYMYFVCLVCGIVCDRPLIVTCCDQNGSDDIELRSDTVSFEDTFYTRLVHTSLLI